VFGMNSLKQRLTKKKELATDYTSMPTTTIDEDVIEQQ
jgi:hypothetical protein